MGKSTWCVCLSASSGFAQVCDNKIQGQVKSGEQPFLCRATAWRFVDLQLAFPKHQSHFFWPPFQWKKNASPLNVHKNSPTLLNYFTWRKVPYFFASHSQGCHNETLEVMMMVMLHPQLYCQKNRLQYDNMQNILIVWQWMVCTAAMLHGMKNGNVLN